MISSAFAWLDLHSARSDERPKWLGFVRNFLTLVLGSIPQIDDLQQQQIDGLPDQFDAWVFGLVAGTVPCLTAAEDPRSLWQPILDLGSAAHQWVERFFWDWFTDGLRAAQVRLPKVVTGFLNFVIQPAAAGLLLPGIKWLAAAVPYFDSYDWKYGLEENLIAFLHTSWEHHKISRDPSVQGAFLSLLACVVSRGGHAAIALRDRVVNSAAG